MEGVDRVADGAAGAGQVAGDLRGAQAVGAGQEDLTAAGSEGGGRAQARPELLPLGVREGANKER